MAVTAPVEAPLTSRQRAAVYAAATLVPLNSTMVAVALPRIAADFDISVGRTALLVTTYLVAMLVGQPASGRVTDAIGAERALRTALAGFSIASIAAALAPTFPLLVAARIGQALFGAMVTPSVQSMLRASTPPQDRGATFGVLGSVTGIGAALGPMVGGVLVALLGWRSIFAANVPILAAGLLTLPRPRILASAGRPDPSAGGRLANRVFVAGFAIQALMTFGQYLFLLLTPIILDARSWDSASVGLVLTMLTAGLVVTGPLGGRVGDRFGRRVPVSAGVVVGAAAVALAAVGDTTISVAALVAALTLFGVGYGFAMPSVMTATLESVNAARTGTAAGVLSMSRYVGSITTSAVVAVWISDDGGGARRALLVALAAAVVALAASAVLPRNSATD